MRKILSLNKRIKDAENFLFMQKNRSVSLSSNNFIDLLNNGAKDLWYLPIIEDKIKHKNRYHTIYKGIRIQTITKNKIYNI